VNKLIRIVHKRQKYREALDGELATAQCLESVIAGGARVFHDVQADGFNIDHVVVAPGGVFAVETKHRLKPTGTNTKDVGKVRFDGQVLQFPGWVEKKPIDQARRQADWLSKFLSKATGESVEAKPVLALPGWWVDRTGRSDVIVINPKNSSFMLKPGNGQGLAEDRKQRICYQLEQKCQESADARSARTAKR
jgi:hypothetical protein